MQIRKAKPSYVKSSEITPKSAFLNRRKFLQSLATSSAAIAVGPYALARAAKAGVINLTRCMAIDGACIPIRVNCISPGFIETPMLMDYLAGQDDPKAARARVDTMHPLGGIGRPADIAGGFVYLASDEAVWITGTELTIDGGLTAGI